MHSLKTYASLYFQKLLLLIGPEISLTKTVSLERRTLACIWYLGNTETFRSVADRFGVSKGTLHLYLSKFTEVMQRHQILKNLISWPISDVEYTQISEKFFERAGFPNVGGALDGTYIPIRGPTTFRDSYICRKGFPAMHLQAVCDSSLRFLDVFCGYPGSVHDSRVFRNSLLHDALQNLPGKYHLLGDSAYPLSNMLLTPFRDNGHLTSEQKKFNAAHSSTRVDIERSFGLLKGKLRKLKFLDMRKVEAIPGVVVTCCVLHNFILMNESFDEDMVEFERDENVNESGSETSEISERSAENLSGIEKRQKIMNLLG